MQRDTDLIESYKKSLPALEAIAVKSGQMDFKGIVVFDDLKPGNYWLIGISKTRGGLAFWKTKVKVEAGQNKCLLDQNNAAYVH